MCGHVVLNEKEGNLFQRFQKLSAMHWTRKFSFPLQRETAILLASVKTTTEPNWFVHYNSPYMMFLPNAWCSAFKPIPTPIPSAPVNFTAIERCGTCILACSLLDFVRVLVRIWSEFTVYRFNPNPKSVAPCKHESLKPLRAKKGPRHDNWQQTLIQRATTVYWGNDSKHCRSCNVV